MSVFAGKYSDGKTVFSINAQGGGDINTHYSPNTNSIFHSDMPHLYVEERHRVNLWDGGDGYMIGEMPAQLQQHMNSGNRVIIPIMVFHYGGVEYRRQMTGRHEGVGYSWYMGDVSEFYEVTASRQAGTFPDQMVEWGTFRKGGGRASDEIATQGTGGIMTRFTNGAGEDEIQSALLAKYANGDSAIMPANLPPGAGKPANRYWNPWASPYGNMHEYEYYNVVDPNWAAPLGPKNQGHTYVFCRNQGGRIFGWSKIYMGNVGGRFKYSQPYNVKQDYVTGTALCNQTRGDYQAYIDHGIFNSSSMLQYDVYVAAMEFLVLNLNFDRVGGYSARNIFTGNDILIARDNLTIKGINLRATQFEFLTSISQGAPGNYANNFFATNNQTPAMNSFPDGGSLGMPGIAANGANVMVTPSGGASSGSIPSWKVGTYKIPANSSVEFNGNSNYLALNGQQIWGPSVRPLMMFPGNAVSNQIIGNNDWLQNVGNGGSIHMSTMWVGLNAGDTSTIIMSMEFLGVGLHVSGDRAFELGDPASMHYEGMAQRLNRLEYDVGDSIQHQIMVLQPWQFVPIMSRRNISYSPGGGQQVPRSNIVYFLRKNGDNGGLEFWAYSFSAVGWINTPKFRVNVQRLT